MWWNLLPHWNFGFQVSTDYLLTKNGMCFRYGSRIEYLSCLNRFRNILQNLYFLSSAWPQCWFQIIKIIRIFFHNEWRIQVFANKSIIHPCQVHMIVPLLTIARFFVTFLAFLRYGTMCNKLKRFLIYGVHRERPTVFLSLV